MSPTLSRSPRWRCAATAVCLLLLALVPSFTGAWNADPTEAVYGICNWYTYAPSCGQPPECVTKYGYAAPTIPTLVQTSPVSISRTLISSMKEGPSFKIRRISPLIETVNAITDDADLSTVPNTQPGTMRVEQNGGGVLVSHCTPYNPIFMELGTVFDESLTPAQIDAQKAMFAELFPTLTFRDKYVLEVIDVVFFNGVLHQYDSTTNARSGRYSSATMKEVEVYLRFQEPVIATTGSNGVNDPPVYQSECFRSRKMKLPPQLILGMILNPVPEQRTMNASVITRLLDSIGVNQNELSMGSSAVVAVGSRVPLFPTEASDDPQMVLPAVSYTGGGAQPPCTPSIPRILFNVPVDVPRTIGNYIDGASSKIINANPEMTQEVLPTTVFGRTSMTQQPTEMTVYNPKASTGGGTGAGTSDPKQYSSKFITMRMVVYSLAVANGALLLAVLVLLYARLGWIEWPTSLGGLNQPVEFFAPSYKVLEELNIRPPTPSAEDTEGGPRDGDNERIRQGVSRRQEYNDSVSSSGLDDDDGRLRSEGSDDGSLAHDSEEEMERR